MSNSIFKISGVGIDTENIKYSPAESRCVEDNYSYVHTSISANNDFIVSNYIKSQEGATLITSIDFLNEIGSMLSSHLLEIDRDCIDLLLFNVQDLDLWKKYSKDLSQELDLLKNSKVINEIGLKNPKSVKDIEEIKNLLGSNIKFIALDLCPFNFNYDIVNWCSINEVKLIGFNPFGGNISSANLIECFSIPYLLSFIANYCDVVILSGRDLILSSNSKEFLEKLIGKESSNKYNLTKSVFKLTKPFKKVINTSFYINEELSLYYDNPFNIYNPEEVSVNFFDKKNAINEKLLKDLKENITVLSEVERLINNYFDLVSISILESMDYKSKVAYYRYLVFKNLDTYYPKSLWEYTYLYIDSSNIMINVTEKKKNSWWNKKRKNKSVKTFGFLFTVQNEIPYFYNLISLLLPSKILE